MKRINSSSHMYFYHLAFFSFVFVLTLSQSKSANAQVSLSKPLIEKWQRKIESSVNFTPAISNDSIFIPQSNGDLLSLALLDGSFKWKAQIGGNISAAPIADSQAVYIASASTSSVSSLSSSSHTFGSFRRISIESGVTIWMKMFNTSVCSGLVSNDGSIFGATNDGHLIAIEKKTGNLLWNIANRLLLCSTLTLYNNRLFSGNAAGEIVSIEQNTGRTLWRYQTHTPINTLISAVNKTIYFGDSDNYLYALDERSHRLKWRISIGSNIQSITTTNKGLLVISLDNSVNLFSYQKGSKLWKRLLTGRVTALPLVSDSAVLLAPLAADECIILDLEDGKKLNSLSIGDDNNTFAASLIFRNLLLITTRQKIVAFTTMLPVNHSDELEFRLR